jgi:hypothetical protein
MYSLLLNWCKNTVLLCGRKRGNPEVPLSGMKKSSSCLTENTVHLYYYDQQLILFREIIIAYCQYTVGTWVYETLFFEGLAVWKPTENIFIKMWLLYQPQILLFLVWYAFQTSINVWTFGFVNVCTKGVWRGTNSFCDTIERITRTWWILKEWQRSQVWSIEQFLLT